MVWKKLKSTPKIFITIARMTGVPNAIIYNKAVA